MLRAWASPTRRESLRRLFPAPGRLGSPTIHAEPPSAQPDQRSAAHGAPTHWFHLHVPRQLSILPVDHGPGLLDLLLRRHRVLLPYWQRLLLLILCGALAAATTAAAAAAPVPFSIPTRALAVAARHGGVRRLRHLQQ